MAGHSHWAGIKRKKEVTDKKRGLVFSKLLKAITAAARTEQNPDFNPRLRTAVEKARTANIPRENIDRAIHKAIESGNVLEELTFEAYGPGGVAICIDMVSDNRNRAVQEIKKILTNMNAKLAESGSVLWAFDVAPDGEKTAKFPQEISSEDRVLLHALIDALEANDNVQRVYTTAYIQ